MRESRELQKQTWALDSVFAPWGSAEKGGEEGKEAQRSREPSPATLSNLTVSESLSLDFLV